MNERCSSGHGGSRRRWDARYAGAPQLRPPSELLRARLSRLTPGRALDLACGSGRNALLLARHGWQVLGVDISPVGLRIAQREARRRGIPLELLAADLDNWPLPVSRYDLVCVFRYLDRALCPSIAAAVRQGGMLIYETFTMAQRAYDGGPRDDAYLLQPGELAGLFPDFVSVYSYEGARDEGGQERAVAQFVGRKVS